jgi:hypothetical protein
LDADHVREGSNQVDGLSSEELGEIQARVDKATPGPWFVRYLDDTHAASLIAVSTEPDTGKGERLLEKSEELERISKTLVAAVLIQYPVRYVDMDDALWHENAEFVAHARVDVPRLVQEIARLRELHSTS